MESRHRREFLADVGRGMLIGSVGLGLASDLGLASASAALTGEGTGADAERLTFGPIEPLASLMEDTPAEKLLPIVVERLRSGTDLKRLVAAAALANARRFGGQDYEGYHALMALAPSYQMACELPAERRALPVLKVLYRNTDHIQKMGGASHEALHPLEAADTAAAPTARALREAARNRDMSAAERAFAALVAGSLDDAYNGLQLLVQDNINVHRVVLAWRSWVLLDFTGKEHAHALLRQSVRYCVDEEGSLRRNAARPAEALRTLLPKLLDRRGLATRTPGDRRADDAWIERTAQLIYASNRAQAAEAVAEALADGTAPESVGEAIAVAANQLVLHDPGRRRAEPGKPAGSVHGASVGVHACDAANAWRNIARVSNRRNTYASLIVAAYHTAGQTGGLNAQPYPLAEHREAVRDVKPDDLLHETEAAIRANDQTRACALVDRYGTLGRPERPVFDLLLRYAISEDGALHAEKYYRTVSEEFTTIRPAFRWRQLAALARVTASEHGFPAPGVAQAHELLKLKGRA